MKPRVVIVAWSDAHWTASEDSAEDALRRHKAAIYWSAGVLVRSDAEGVTLAMDYGLPLEATDQATYRSRTFILRSLVIQEFDAGPLVRKPKRAKLPVEVSEL